MYLACVSVSNYRNLDRLEVHLNPEMNFLVGENELGKTNFLDLLDILFNHRTFVRGDFFDEIKPIEVKFSITLTKEEVGVLGDYFDPDNHNQANIIAKQESVYDSLVYYRAENYETDPKEISAAPFRRFNYIKYSSLRTPKDELGFDRERGVGKFLNHLVRVTLNTNGNKQAIINNIALDPIMQRINGTLGKIRPLQRMGIETFADQEHEADLLSRVLLLKNRDAFDIQKSGQGTQFSTMLILSVLERLIALKTGKRWNDNIFTYEKTREKSDVDNFLQQEGKTWAEIQHLVTVSGDVVSFDAEQMDIANEFEVKLQQFFEKTSVNMILGLDEPEIHLHPYMQRSLIKYIARILCNKDDDFKTLLNELLELDEISGQAIVVSHSPSILLDDYKQIVRFYREEGVTKSVSGCQVKIDAQMEKHLLLQLPSIKEAFFSKCVVVVEGKSEVGAMSVWKDTFLDDADELGISIIGADGFGSVKPIVRLLNELKIPNVSVMDKDDNNDVTYASVADLFFTNGRDFEEDFYTTVAAVQPNCETLFNCLSFVRSGLNTFQKNEFLIPTADKYGIAKTWDVTVEKFLFCDGILKTDSNLHKAMFINLMGLMKSITFGRYIGFQTTVDQIPPVYCQVLKKAIEKAEAEK